MNAKELTELYGTASNNIISLQKRVDYLESLTEKLALRLDDAKIDIADIRVDMNRMGEKSMAKVKCIIKRPDEQYGHVTNISVSLENLQKTVEGYIEAVTLAPDIGLIMLVNEEGKLKNMDFNFHCGIDTIVGPAIIIGQKGEDFCDIPIDLATWKKLLHSWGN